MGIAGMLLAAFVTGSTDFVVIAVILTFSGWAGQIFPIFPVGILSLFGTLMLAYGALVLPPPKSDNAAPLHQAISTSQPSIPKKMHDASVAP
jgi:hypothetical protein